MLVWPPTLDSWHVLGTSWAFLHLIDIGGHMRNIWSPLSYNGVRWVQYLTVVGFLVSHVVLAVIFNSISLTACKIAVFLRSTQVFLFDGVQKIENIRQINFNHSTAIQHYQEGRPSTPFSWFTGVFASPWGVELHIHIFISSKLMEIRSSII